MKTITCTLNNSKLILDYKGINCYIIILDFSGQRRPLLEAFIYTVSICNQKKLNY